MSDISAGVRDKVLAKSCADMSDLADGSINCVVTSPPFEDQRDYSADVENHGNYRGDEFIARLRAPMRELFRVLADDGSAFINFMPGRKDGFVSSTFYSFPHLLEDSGFKLVQVLWWIKSNARPSADQRVLKNATEPIFHIVKSAGYYVDKDAIRGPSLYAARDKRSWKYHPGGAASGNWHCPALERLNKMSVQDVLGSVLDPEGNAFPLKKTQDQASLHPGKMPEELADWLIRYGSRAGDVVLDPWAGAGTTLCRAKALGRHYVGYELVSAYAQLCEERLEPVDFGEALDGPSAVVAKPVRGRKQESAPVLAGPLPLTCRQCGGEFTPKKRWASFCSRKCRFAFHNEKNRRKAHDEEADVDGGRSPVALQQEGALQVDKQEKDPSPQGRGEAPL